MYSEKIDPYLHDIEEVLLRLKQEHGITIRNTHVLDLQFEDESGKQVYQSNHLVHTYNHESKE